MSYRIGGGDRQLMTIMTMMMMIFGRRFLFVVRCRMTHLIKGVACFFVSEGAYSYLYMFGLDASSFRRSSRAHSTQNAK